MARDARRGKKDAARKLQEAAEAIRDKKLQDKIRYSKAVVRAGRAEQSRQLEGEIGSDLEALGQKLQEAANAAGAVRRGQAGGGPGADARPRAPPGVGRGPAG